MIDDPSGRIDYQESGHGPSLVLVPGSVSTGAAWRPVIAAWQGSFRCITTSLPGYGGTAERRTAADFSIDRAVEAVIRRAGGAPHLVGHSFGGLVAVAVALRRRVRIASLGVLEAPAVALLREHGDLPAYLDLRAMTNAYAAEFAAGRADGVVTLCFATSSGRP
jgi:pimeloyl-ACP methyl ester carboxylesterase